MFKRWAILAAKLAMTVVPLLYLLRTVDVAETWAAGRSIRPSMFVASILLLIVQVMLCTVRWRFVLRVMGARLTFAKACEILWIGNFFGLVLPGAVGGDAVRMWKTRRAGLSVSTSINSVLLERAATVFGLALLVAATEPLLANRLSDTSGLWVFPVLTLIGAAGIGFISLLDKLPSRWRRFRAVQAFATLAQDTREVFLRPGNGLTLMVVVVIGHLNLALGVYVLAVGLGAPISVLECMVLVPPVILITTLPISIAGWGARELAMVTIFGFVGVPPAQALATSVLFGVVTTVTAFPGGLLWLFSDDRRQRLAETEAARDGFGVHNT